MTTFAQVGPTCKIIGCYRIQLVDNAMSSLTVNDHNKTEQIPNVKKLPKS